jgi:uncharacterized membrane protein (UPF0127 family)
MKIKINGEIIEAEECRTIWQKTKGLMFRKNSKPLVFKFNKSTRQSIHSFFCKPFLAIWLNNGKVVDKKIVKPFRAFIKPKKRFDMLVEVLLENKDIEIFLSSKNRKI